jgi:hypothetical protein
MRYSPDYNRGWKDARQNGKDVADPKESDDYKEGFRHGTIAREQADNYDLSDYYENC